MHVDWPVGVEAIKICTQPFLQTQSMTCDVFISGTAQIVFKFLSGALFCCGSSWEGAYLREGTDVCFDRNILSWCIISEH